MSSLHTHIVPPEFHPFHVLVTFSKMLSKTISPPDIFPLTSIAKIWVERGVVQASEPHTISKIISPPDIFPLTSIAKIGIEKGVVQLVNLTQEPPKCKNRHHEYIPP